MVKDIDRVTACSIKQFITAVVIFVLTGFNSVSASERVYQLDVPAIRAFDALDMLAEKTQHALFYRTNELTSVTVNSLDGSYTLPEALNILLKGTHLNAVVTEKGVIIVSTMPDTQIEESDHVNTKKSLLATTVMGFLFGATQVAGAVDAVEPDSVSERSAMIEEVLVTARRREENLQDVPISISAYSAADLEAMSLTSLKELGQFTPNFSFFNHSSRGRSAGMLFIRGVGQTDPRIFWDPGVGLYVDGVYTGRMNGIDIDLMALERVEILRGPQGTLFGKNTIGGAVNVVTAKPTDEFLGTAEITTGRYSRIDAKANINVPLVPGKLAAKFAGTTRNRDGYGQRLDFFTGEEVDEEGNEDSISGRAIFNWTPSENVAVLFSIDDTKVREKAGAGKTVAINNTTTLAGLLNGFVDPQFGEAFLTDSDFTNYATGGNLNEFDTWGAALTVDWDLGSLAVKSITSYREMDGRVEVEPDGTIYTMINSEQTVEQDQFSQEFQLIGNSFDDRLEWVLGVYYFEESGTEENQLDVYRELSDFMEFNKSFTRFYQIDNKSYAAFGQGTYALTDKLSLTAGLRYTSEEKEVGRQRASHVTGEETVPFASVAQDWDAVSGRVGFEYQWNDDVMTYISAARGFKSGGMNGASVVDTDFEPFDPEYIWTYEVGLRSDLLDQRLRFNASLFYSDYEDVQFTVRTTDEMGAPIRIVDNAAKARIKGFEIEAVAEPASGLMLTAGVGYADAEYTKLEPGAPITEDTEFVATPKWTVTLSGQYAAPLGDLGELIGRLDYIHKTKIYHDTGNSPFLRQEGYALLNARLSFENAGGKWALSIFGTNLTDKHYTLAGTDLLGNIGFVQVQYARPREWGVNLKYRF